MRLVIPAASAVLLATFATFTSTDAFYVPGALADETKTRPEPETPPEALPAPVGPVLLTVSGGGLAKAAPVQIDVAMLDMLPQRRFSTSTIWTSGVSEFSGVELRTLLDRLGITSGTLKITAVNDYSVQIPVAEIAEGGALLADRRDGKVMTLREKGPLWVVYPYDSAPEFRNEVVYSRSVSQVDRIEVLP